MPKHYKEEEEKEVELTEDQELANKLVGIAVKQLETSAKFKEHRLRDIAKNEDLYLGKRRPSVKGRFNVPLPIMEGFIETLLSKTDDPPKVGRKAQKESDAEAARKLDAQWEVDTNKERWNQKDRWGKKLAYLSGRAIYKTFSESDPEYKSFRENVDHYDFHCEPQGGAYLEDHRFLGQTNIFRDADQLTSEFYDQSQVKELVARTSDEGFKRNDNVLQTSEKTDRMKSLGLTVDGNEFIGEQVYNLTEWCMVYEGKRYHLIFNYATGTWLRFNELEESFESNLYPFTSWATEEDPFNFWNRAPADIMRPVALAQQMIFNQMLDADMRRIYGQRLFDPKVIQDPSQLEFRPEGLVEANLAAGQTINNAVLRMQTPEVTSSINLLEFMKSFVGRETGVTASAQGFGEEDRVGILESNLRQVSDRMALLRKSYEQEWKDAALRYDWGVYEHLPANTAIKVIGEAGAEWKEIVKEDLEPEFDILLTGGSAQLVEDELLAKQQSEGLAGAMVNPSFAGELNPRAALEQHLRNSKYTEEQIRSLMDKDNYGNRAVLEKAAQAIQTLQEGEEPRIARDANMAFAQKLVNFAADHTDGNDELFAAIHNYLGKHQEIIVNNTLKEAASQAMEQPPAQAGNVKPQPSLGKSPELEAEKNPTL